MPSNGNQLEPGEEVIAKIDQHWIVKVMPFFVYTLFWITFFILFLTYDQLKAISPVIAFIVFFIAFLVLFIGHHFFFLFIIQDLISTLVITNKRIIEIHFFPFLRDDVSYLEIEQIHEIDKEKHGFLKNLLNYGNVLVNIPGRPKLLTFRNIRYPSKFINLIEGIKAKKPIYELDLRSMGASCPPQYQHLLKGKKVAG